MKILLLANYYANRGAISGQVRLLQQYLRNEHLHVDIFSTIGNPLVRLCKVFRLFFIAKTYDIVHAHGCSFFGFFPIFLGVCASKLYKKRLIATFHGGDATEFFTRHHTLAKFCFTRCDAVIVQSPFLQSIFEQFHFKTTVLPNIVVPLESALPHPPLNEKSVKLLSVRQFKPIYNIKCILRAYEIIKREYPAATLTLLGDGPQEKELRQFIAQRNLQDVIIKGFIDNQDIYSYHAKSNVLLSAPRIDNMPVSLIEAMNSGLLIVSSNVGGVKCMIENNVNGLLFDSDDHEALAQHVKEAIEQPQRVHQLVQKAREDAKKYQWNRIKNSLFALYQGNNEKNKE